MASSAYEKQMQNLWKRYSRQIDILAQTAYTQRVRPEMQKRGWRFTAGMGAWSISDENGHSIYEDELIEAGLDWLWELLTAEVPGFRSNDFGSLMDAE